MTISFKRILLLLILTLLLLMSLLSWTTHIVAAPITPDYHTHWLYPLRDCPPPPYDCW
ncbi:MAG TPA: hypothetical protein VII61_00380 [Ktedonobacteraceae bacterium]